MNNDDFRRAIEAIKLRAPVEDVVRERVPGLKKAGALWVACCPFHDEKTPSFKVDPRRGTWHCFGACAIGGDQISFLERMDNVSFMDAVEILAARTGVELPRSGRGARAEQDDAHAAERALLEQATDFYRHKLATSEGQVALRYLSERGLAPATNEAFGIGFAPGSGQAFVDFARSSGVPLARAEAVGLVRTSDSGRPYDFFRARLMIPIRDAKGRTVGFGARRLSDDDASGPKYVNTPETAFFHKGTLIYALDRALAHVRTSNHIVLVEGYTDVMAAHQAGVANVVAVLGTSTTEDHAALIRRSGARRVSLVFDGDEAGRKAAARALHGLLPLDVTIDVVSLPGGQDPCDLLTRGGAEPFLAQLELAESWFDFAVRGISEKRGAELSREVDRVLELVSRIAKPVHRESLVSDLAARVNLPVESLREQWRASSAERRPRARAPVAPVAPSVPARSSVDPRVVQAFEDLLGALVLDASLVPMARPFRDACPTPELARVFDAVLALYADEDALIDTASVLSFLGDDPVRHALVPIVERAHAAESPRALLEGQVRYMKARQLDLEKRALAQALRAEEQRASEAGGVEAAVRDPEVIELSKRVYESSGRIRELRAQ